MKKTIALLLSLLFIVSLFPAAFAANEDSPLRIGALKGPTGFALAHMMAQNDGSYAFTLAGAPTEMNALLIKGDVDIAAIPINLGAVLYNKTQGKIKALSLITGGMLYVLERGDSIHSIADLEGKTIVAAGQGSTPEYLTRFLLDANQINATLDFRSEHAEVTTLAVSGFADIILVPEPHVTTVLLKDPSFRIALDITEEFRSAAALRGYENAALSMSMVVVRTDYLEKNPEKVLAFLKDLEASIAFSFEDPAQTALDIAAAGIIPSAAIAERALPSTSLLFVTGEDMQNRAEVLYTILHAANPSSVGGSIPAQDFYVK